MSATNFENVISLGSLGSVALEIERAGLRNESMPFDWIISRSMKTVMELIDSHFDGFLDEDELTQSNQHFNVYADNEKQIEFWNDFDRYKPHKKQLPQIIAKYERRIDRFYDCIACPTLFIRYIINEADFNYIIKNNDMILKTLKKYNSDNEIIYIANENLKADTNFKVYYVKPDENDKVARAFLEKCTELKNYLASDIFDSEKRKANLEFYEQKKLNKQKKWLIKSAKAKLKKIFIMPYRQNSKSALGEKIIIKFNSIIRSKRIISKEKSAVTSNNITIICNNCRAGTLLHDLGKPFNTPTINLFIKNHDFVNLLEKMPHIFNKPLEMSDEIREFPVGELDGVKIYFNHSATFEQAKADWERRVPRIDYDNLFVIMTQLKGCSYDDLLRFDQLPFEKVVFTAKKYPEIKSSVYVPGYEKQGYCEYLGGFKKLSQFGLREDEKYFDYIQWINKNTGKETTDENQI